jgi:hypothetical protein
MSAHHANFTPADIYAGGRKQNLTLGSLGALKTASREVLRAQLTGTNVDETKVGRPGDVIVGAERIAAFLNSLCSP